MLDETLLSRFSSDVRERGNTTRGAGLAWPRPNLLAELYPEVTRPSQVSSCWIGMYVGPARPSAFARGPELGLQGVIGVYDTHIEALVVHEAGWLAGQHRPTAPRLAL